MKRFDAVVVGAGPAGSLAAYRLARLGATVALCDRARFPRDKPCGGAVSGRARRLLPFSIDPVVEGVARVVELRHRAAAVERAVPLPLAYMTQRSRLDAYLVDRATAAGAALYAGAKVTDVAAGTNGTVVTCGGERVRADVVIGADGANGASSRLLGLRGRRVFCVALEAHVAYDRLPRAIDAGRIVLEVAEPRGGYGWLFPKGDHVNVGVGGWLSQGPSLRRALSAFCARHGLDPGALTGVRGWRLPLRVPGSPTASARSCLIGDAAGLIDPLSGDGMYECFLSARLAADEALAVLAGDAADFSGYRRRLFRRLARAHAGSWALKLAADAAPRSSFRLATAPPVWTLIARALAGGGAEPESLADAAASAAPA